MKIAVCGCSFSALSLKKQYAGTHWGELLANELNAELLVLARQGISNNAIRLQIDEAIKLESDLVIINATGPARIEVPIDMTDSTSKNTPPPGRGYIKSRGLANFNYNKGPYSMISETMFSLIEWPRHQYRLKKLDPNIGWSTKSYSAFLYDSLWKMQCDNWVINSGLWTLHDHHIKFIYNPWMINMIYPAMNTQGTIQMDDNDRGHGVAVNYHDMPNWFVEKYFVPLSLYFREIARKNPIVNDEDPGYHINIEGQKFIADEYLKLIKEQM